MSKRLSPQLQQKIPEDAYCEKHLEPLLLFCDDDQIILCGKCFQSQEHRHHVVYGVQEAAENYKVSFMQMPEPSGALAASSYLLTYLFGGRYSDPPDHSLS